MSNYYKSKNLAIKQVDKLISSACKDKTEIDKKLLIYEILVNYEVSKKSIDEAIDFAKAKYGFVVKDNMIRWE